jgi:hypothetical protein
VLDDDPGMTKLFGVAGVLCLFVAVAGADPEPSVFTPLAPPVPPAQSVRGIWLELGDSYGHVIAEGDRLRTQLVSFSPRVLLTRLIYVGAEVGFGSLSGTGILPTDGLPVGLNGAEMGTVGALGGEVVAARGIGGVRAFLGPVSGSGELAVGVQDAMVSDGGAVSAVDNVSGTWQLRGRVDYWATPRLTVGANAGIDMLEPGDFSIGLGLGVHFEPYDGTWSRPR